MLTAALAVSGCGHGEEQASKPSDLQPIAQVEAPDPQLADSAVVATVKGSIVKIGGNGPTCELGGSGFVVAPNRVMTPAQVVAGGETVTIELDGKSFDAHVVSYNPRRDLAILDVPNLPARPLTIAAEDAVSGSDAIALGYSDAGDFAAIPSRIREVINLNGPDLYKTETVSREVYSIRGNLKDATGGPLIDTDGTVVGVSFGVAIDDADTSFALTAKEIAPQLADLTNATPVSTEREKC